MNSHGRVGAPSPRIDGEAKVTGRAEYAGDRKLPGLLYAGILRCPYPHARVLDVDTTAAAGLKGVYAVLSRSSTEGHCWYDEDVPIFSDLCRFAGEEVAAVAAESRQRVDEALAAIEVGYERLPFVVDMDAAKVRGAPRVHASAAGNLVGEPDSFTRGDVDAGFAAAEVIVEQTYTTQCVVHNALEPHGCTAEWHGDELLLWVSTQGVFSVREGVAKKLGIDKQKVRVICDYMGGGFGAKQVDWKQTLIAALLAKRTKRPVQLMLGRRGENLAVGNRNPTKQRVRLGATGDGCLCAIDVEIDCGIGAYSTSGETSHIGGIYQSLYACDNVRTLQRNYYTHTGPAVAFRAPGYAEGAFGLEQAMDELAERLGMDPLELRRRNYTRRDAVKDKPYSSPDALEACLAAIESPPPLERLPAANKTLPDNATNHTQRRAATGTRLEDATNHSRPAAAPTAEDAAPAGDRVRRGSGIAACVWVGGSPNPPAEVRLRLYRHGILELVCGSQDIGTGTRTVLAQMAADAMGYPLDKVRCQIGDTDPGLEGPTSSGSSTVPTTAPAVYAAANALQSELRQRLRDGQGLPDDPEQWAAALDVDYVEGIGECPDASDAVSIRTFGAQRAEVEVDLATGAVRVTRLTVATDCGRIVNPLLAYGQVMGGAIQGLGFALTEERIVDSDLGLVLNANLEDYEVPTAADTPAIEHAGIDMPDESLPAPHAKGLGEPPLIPAAPAIANAVFDATGVRIRSLPISRQRLLAALAAGREAR
jgi:xanthine dehydrogenase YagR molybdenum-binding subunit